MSSLEHPDLKKLTGPDRRRLPLLTAVVLGAAVATLLGLLWLWPWQKVSVDLEEFGVASQTFSARVDQVAEGPCAGTAPADQIDCVDLTFVLLDGPEAGLVLDQELSRTPSTPKFNVGDRVVLSGLEFDGVVNYQFADRERRPVLLLVTLVFAAAVIVLGRRRGAAALAGLLASVGVLVWFIVPAILGGRSPVMVALVGAAAIGFLALYLAHGFSPLTHVALLGTLSALGLTVVLSWLAVILARFSGFTTEESLFLTLLDQPINASGLVLAGIVLGALGALDDVTVTQASAVWEIRAANPSLPIPSLFAAGLRVGRDHIASTVNTLLLAYAGASLPLLLLFALSRQSAGAVINSEVIAVEVVRTMVGSIGLVTAVPITTWMAASVAGRADWHRVPSQSIVSPPAGDYEPNG